MDIFPELFPRSKSKKMDSANDALEFKHFPLNLEMLVLFSV